MSDAVEIKVWNSPMVVLPNPENLKAPYAPTSRHEFLGLSANGMACGCFDAKLIDLKPLSAPIERPENFHLPTEVAHWLSTFFGEAVLIRSLVPQPLPSGSGFEWSLKEGEILPA
jgi:hypothetical protein